MNENDFAQLEELRKRYKDYKPLSQNAEAWAQGEVIRVLQAENATLKAELEKVRGLLGDSALLNVDYEKAIKGKREAFSTLMRFHQEVIGAKVELETEVAEYRQLMQVIHDLRMIPNWTRILLATDDDPFIVFIDETDVGGERILSTSGDTLLAACQAAYAQYLLWNRDYAAKVGSK